jgi:hypothetical protein
MPLSNFIIPAGAAAQAVFTQTGYREGMIAGDTQMAVLGWLPPTAATLQQLQATTAPDPITLGTITVELYSQDLDNLAAPPVLLGAILLDATHQDGVLLFALPATPRLLIAVLATASVAVLAGGGFVVAALSGTLDG